MKALRAKVRKFVDEEIIPREMEFAKKLDEGNTRWKIMPIME